MAVNSELDVVIKGQDQLSPTLAQLESRVIRWVGAISASVAAIKIGTAPVVATAQFERELANVTKTTGFARSEIAQLSDEILKMSTRIDVSAVDLTKIAAAAGQQGLGRFGVEGVLAFTDSVSRMASVLDVTVEQAGTDIGKIVNIFKVPLKDIETAVSTFNQVSNNSTASGEELLDVVKRIGDAAGALNLQQATALAATGLDFGASPEVVGTAFSNMFARLRERATEFSALLKTDTASWIKMIEDDGLVAYQKVLAAFRELKPEDQQKAITKLFGGGRIGALVNKLVQDTQDTVLTRNFEQALKGKEGTSAIKEQETVLNTLVAQSTAALNSLTKLGAEATEQAMGPLTQYAAQLNTALQSDGLRSFLTLVARSVLELVDGFASGVKFLADLNVNWENFIRVAKVFLQLKLAQYIGGALLGSITKFSTGVQSIAKGTEAVTAASKNVAAAQSTVAASQAASDAASKSSIAARLLGYEELQKKVAAYVAAKAAEAKAEQDVAAAAAAATAAKSKAVVGQGREQIATSQLGSAASAAQAQRAVLAAAEATARAEQEAISAAQASKQEASLQKTTARRLAIEQEFQTKRQAIRETGTRVGLTAITREREQALAIEEASYQRSLRSINSYYTRRAAEAATGSAALVAAERAAYMKVLGEFDGAVAKQASRATQAAAAGAGAAAADAALAGTTARLTVLQQASKTAGAAMVSFGVVMRSVATVVATAGRLIASGFFWITIIYSIADSFGLLDGLGAKFQAFTDKLGFTSEASRRAKVETEKQTQALRDQQKALEDLIAKYDEFINASTGQVDRKEVGRLVQIASTSEDESTKQQALAQLDELARAMAAKRQQILESINGTNDAIAAEEKKKIADYQKELAALIKTDGTVLPKLDPMQFGDRTVDNSKRIAELRSLISASEKTSEALVQNSAQGKVALEGLEQSITDVNKAFGGMFVPETLQYAQENITSFANLQIELKEASERYKELKQEARGGSPAVAEDADKARVAFENLSRDVATARDNISKFVKEKINGPEIPENVRASWETLLNLMNAAPGVAKTAIAAAGAASSVDLTGANANPNKKTPSTGDTGWSAKPDKGAENRARREARARLELARARIQQENRLQEEASKQLLENDTRAFDRGLKSITEYYDERNRIRLQANQFDLDDKAAELKAVEDEIAAAKEQSEKLKYEATAVRLKGDIAVLQAQRASISAQEEEEKRKAAETFADRIRSEINKLGEQGILPTTLPDAFKGNLDELSAQYRVFLAQLRSEGKGALADSLLEGLRGSALQATLSPLQQDMTRMQDQVSLYQSALNQAVTNGKITAEQATVAYNRGVQSQITAMQALLDKQMEFMRLNSDQAGTRPYEALRVDIERTRQALESLRTEQNRVAIDFNTSVQNTLGNFLGTLEPKLSSIKEGVLNMFLSIAQSAQQQVGNALAGTIMQSIGSTGSGGLGGMLQNLIQGPGSSAAQGLAQRGGTPATPLYVTDVASGGADTVDAVLEDVDTDKFNLFGDEAESYLSKFTDGLSTTFDSLTGSLGTLFDGFGDGLGSLFSSLLSGLGGGGGGGFMSTIFSFFGAAHRGGVAGSPKMFRKVNPAVFANAMRYHVGGTAGQSPGLRANEVPTILERGETIRTQQQEDAVQTALQAQNAESSGKGNINVYVVTPDQVPTGTSAQDIIVTVADNISRGGQISKLIKTIPR